MKRVFWVIVLSLLLLSISSAQVCTYRSGDINSDGQRIGGDVTYGVRYFKSIGSQPPDSCFMDSTGTYLYVAGDVNGNCEFRGSDITRLVAYFKGNAELSYCHFFPPPEVLPVLSTADVSGVTQTSAECGGTITFDGGSPVTARGVCWSTNPTPTVADSKTINGSGIGSFSSSITGLIANTPYHVRAYATNSAGTGYGIVDSFTTATEESTGTVTDIDGNVYQTVTIGSRVWMAENLKVTHYRNGDPIPHVTNNSTWSGLSTGAYCNYNNDTAQVAVYGRLYNWYAVDDSRNIAPAGWHMPSDDEWKQLEMYLGMSQAEADLVGWRGTDEGGKLKESGTMHWFSPNTGATNESGFSALPGGCRNFSGSCNYMGVYAFYWSSTEYDSNYAWSRYLSYDNSAVYRLSFMMQDGFSVRCVKD
jgi:uncharacterized protein (TIGR02145 family)